MLSASEASRSSKNATLTCPGGRCQGHCVQDDMGRKHVLLSGVRAKHLVLGLLVIFSLVTAQCGAPTPRLPSTPSGDRPIRVAVLTPMTGELATFGEIVRNGITLAFDEWNERGGVNGQPIQWVLEDTRCDPLEARRAAERVILEQDVRFIVGGVCSESAIPIARVADERGALFISATATHPLVTVDSSGKTRALVFRASYAYPYQGRAAARFALDELGARRAAVLVDPSNDLVRSAADEFSAAFRTGGGQVLATPTYARGMLSGASQGAEFDALVAQAIQMQPDVLYVPDAYPVANRVGSRIQEQDLRPALIGSEVWDNGALNLEALEGAYFTLHYFRENPDPAAEAWQERYVSAFALRPDTLAALGYDAAGLLASAMERADGLSPGAAAHSLEALDYQGVTGSWRFDAQHNPLKPVVVVRIQRGEVVFHTAVRP